MPVPIQQSLVNNGSESLDNGPPSMPPLVRRAVSSESTIEKEVGPPKKKPKKQCGGENDLEGRRQISQISDPKEKVKALIDLKSRVPADTSELTKGARNFVILQLQPALECLNNHFGGNVEDFIQKWAVSKKNGQLSLALSNFGKSCKDAGVHFAPS